MKTSEAWLQIAKAFHDGKARRGICSALTRLCMQGKISIEQDGEMYFDLTMFEPDDHSIYYWLISDKHSRMWAALFLAAMADD